MIRKIFEFFLSFFRKEESVNNRLLEVVKESDTGRNLKFRDSDSGIIYTLSEMRNLIANGEYPNYIVDRNGVVKSKPGVPNLG